MRAILSVALGTLMIPDAARTSNNDRWRCSGTRCDRTVVRQFGVPACQALVRVQEVEHVGGIPNEHLRSNINVQVRAKSGKRFSEGMKYKCHLTPKGFRDDFTYPLLSRGARAAVNREIINNARKAVLVISGTL